MLVVLAMGFRSTLPWKSARTARRPLRNFVFVLKDTVLVYVQSGRSRALRDEIVVWFLWKRIVTVPEQMTLSGGWTQYAAFSTPGGQKTGMQLFADVGLTPGAQKVGGGVSVPVVVNLNGRVRSRRGVVVADSDSGVARAVAVTTSDAVSGAGPAALADRAKSGTAASDSAPNRIRRFKTAPSVSGRRTRSRLDRESSRSPWAARPGAVRLWRCTATSDES
jgi:hypothetical protein